MHPSAWKGCSANFALRGSPKFCVTRAARVRSNATQRATGALRRAPDASVGTPAGGRRSGMHARVTTIQGSPDKMDDATSHIQEQTLAQLRKMEGFKGFVALGDRQRGKVTGVAFWESEEALRATEDRK